MVLACLGSLLGLVSARAQPPLDSALPVPRLFTVMPPGGRAGATVEVTFTGADVEEPQGLIFSDPAIRAGVVLPIPASAADPKKPAPPPPITKFMVTIPAGTPPGSYDVRLVNRWGVSNARVFEVGELEEVLEKEPNNEIEQAQRVAVNTTINGTIASPTDVDYYVFLGKKGQRIVVSCLASSIDSRLIAAVEMYDRAGRLLAANHHYRGTDALTDCTLPEDGDYFVRVHEFAYTKGNAEHFYRLSVSTAPWIDALYPPVVEPGATAYLTVFGRNLPQGQLDRSSASGGRALQRMTVKLKVPDQALESAQRPYTGTVAPESLAVNGFEYRICNQAGVSNPALLSFGRAFVVLDNEHNETSQEAQYLDPPCEIAARVTTNGHPHWYAFPAKKGDVYAIELFGERLGGTADLYFRVINAATKETLGELDDNAETLSRTKFITRSTDPPRYRFVVPADGNFHLMVASRKAAAEPDPRQVYRLSIVREQSDFRLVIMPPAEYTPDSVCLLRGGEQNLTVLVDRVDGWNGEIRLEAEGLPPGVTCPAQTLGAGAKQANLVLSAARESLVGTWELKVRGTAVIGGRKVVHEARPAGVTWPVPPQQNIPAISRLDRSLVVAVRDRAPYRVAATVDKPAFVQGDKAALTLKVDRYWPDFKAPLQAVAVDLPPNLAVNNNQPVTIAADKNAANVQLTTGPNVLPGNYSFLLRTTAQVPYSKDPAAKQKPSINVVLPSTSVTVAVLPKQVAALSVTPAKISLKAGGRGEVLVRLARMYDFSGEFKVRLVLPANVKGITAEEVTIPPGKTEVKLPFRAGLDAVPGNSQDVVVRAVAALTETVSATHDAKLSLSIVK